MWFVGKEELWFWTIKIDKFEPVGALQCNLWSSNSKNTYHIVNILTVTKIKQIRYHKYHSKYIS